MRLAEILRSENVRADIHASGGGIPIAEQEPVGPLNAEQARKRQEKNSKKLRRAVEITRTAATRAAEIRADVR